MGVSDFWKTRVLGLGPPPFEASVSYADTPSDQLLPFPWEQGEHMAISGQTGSGKSTLVSWLLPFRDTSLILRSKPDDVRYVSDARLRRAMPKMDSPLFFRLELEPKHEEQGYQFAVALDRVWRQGGWTWYGDEAWYLEELGLRPYMERLITQGRSKKITGVVGMQRPARVSRFLRSEPTHVLSFTISGKDAKSLGEDTSDEFGALVRALPRYHFAWFYRPTQIVWTGFLDLRRRVLEAVPVAPLDK